MPSPPPPYNFAVIPTVATRHPLWEGYLNEEIRSSLDRGLLLDKAKESLGTSQLDALPDMILRMPEDTSAPFVLTLGLGALFAGLIVRSWLLMIIGTMVLTAALVVWLWPRRQLREREVVHG